MKSPKRKAVRTISEGKGQLDRQPVRPIKAVGICDKKFELQVPFARDVKLSRVHPLVVLLDLRKGSLKSLGRYLQQEGGIPDGEVADELRKLISGTVEESNYRLAAIRHPDAAENPGGRPRGSSDELTQQDHLIVEHFDEVLRIEGKKYLARAETAVHFDVSGSTVDRALRRANALNELEKTRRETIQRREDALANLVSTESTTEHVTKPV